MSDFLTKGDDAREPLTPVFSDTANPIGLNGIEFIEYITPKPQALGQVLEMMGFHPIARHAHVRSNFTVKGISTLWSMRTLRASLAALSAKVLNSMNKYKRALAPLPSA